jgi:hypothetical protein
MPPALVAVRPPSQNPWSAAVATTSVAPDYHRQCQRDTQKKLIEPAEQQPMCIRMPQSASMATTE